MAAITGVRYALASPDLQWGKTSPTASVLVSIRLKKRRLMHETQLQLYVSCIKIRLNCFGDQSALARASHQATDFCD